MAYEVSTNAEGDRVVVSLLGHRCCRAPWYIRNECASWTSWAACDDCDHYSEPTWTVSPPSLLAKLFGVTLSAKVTRAIGKAVAMRVRLERQDERARLACAEATRVAESALERKVRPESPWPPPPRESTAREAARDAGGCYIANYATCMDVGHRVGECDRKCPFGLVDKADPPPKNPTIDQVRAENDLPPMPTSSVPSNPDLPRLCYSWEGCAGWQSVADEVAL